MSSDEDESKVGGVDHSQQQAIINEQNIGEEDWDKLYPNRPKNRHETLPFRTLFEDLFEPLTDNLSKKKPSGRPTGRKAGPNSGPSGRPSEIRKAIIDRYMSRWRREVGDDFFPAMRLIIPEKDRERAMYGLKEKALGRYLVKILRIDRNSDDAVDLLNWRLPGQSAASRSAGDFAGRCYEVLKKRAHLIEPGTMTITEVDSTLDELSKAPTEEAQLPLLKKFYKRMNPDELTWLIRIILRHMRIGATEKTILDAWHPDAEKLFNVSSSLRRVCWELYNPSIRLEQENAGVGLMQCYQPQLAHQPKHSFAQMVVSMKPRETDPEFWIEEKLDGERMQLHMVSDDQMPGGKRFKFWSRKAKDYTYLYGDGFHSKESALTKYIQEGFKDGVENVILDGEMIAWNKKQDAIVPFGSLKTAAIGQQSNSEFEEQPFYRVFDILLLNDRVLTQYTLRDRRRALEATVNKVHRRLEILDYSIGITADDIENKLRDVIMNASEGLVLKNPRVAYKLNARYDDWVKVKPEYMTEFGESLDCLVIGGYYGTGRRGGNLSSFMCGLRMDAPDGTKKSKFLSFFKFGGGMTAENFAAVRHNTQGKWHDYNPKHPPMEHIQLTGKPQGEMPHVWIKPEDSFVVEVKAASVNESVDYGAKVTLRFPRFKRFRDDKDWKSALSVEEFHNVRVQAETKAEENRQQMRMVVANDKRRRRAGDKKKRVVVAGYSVRESAEAVYDRAKSNIFSGLTIYVITASATPQKKSKVELEEIVKAHGGRVVQSAEVKTADEVLCVAERKTVKVASLEKRGQMQVVRPIWLFDCIEQGKTDFAKGLEEIVLPFEPDRHLFYVPEDRKDAYEKNVDHYGDSYARDITKAELKELMDGMGKVKVAHNGIDKRDLLDPNDCRGSMFDGLVIWFGRDRLSGLESDVESRRIKAAEITARFAGASIAAQFEDTSITHIVLSVHSNRQQIRKEIARRKKLPRVVTLDWIEQCWGDHTRLDEERFADV